MNKSIITNISALSLTIYGMFSPVYSTEIFMAGLFALSGGLTNWLAIHMLFEKIPFLYGSGVIPERFEEFSHEDILAYHCRCGSILILPYNAFKMREKQIKREERQ